MPMTVKTKKDAFTEVEAAKSMGISVARLHMLLDLFIFNDGSGRPANVVFRTSDLVLLSYWNLTLEQTKVLCMPNPSK